MNEAEVEIKRNDLTPEYEIALIPSATNSLVQITVLVF